MRARDLKHLDEIEVLYRRKLRRCRVVGHPELRGDRVEFTVVPVIGPKSPARLAFLANAEIPRHSDRTPVRPTQFELQQAWILRTLMPGDDAKTAEDLLKIARKHEGTEFAFPSQRPYRSDKVLMIKLGAAMRSLLRRGELRLRPLSKGRNGYRRLLPLVPGYPVALNLRGDNPRYGWVESIQFVVSIGEERMAIRWLDGTLTLEREERLDPVCAPYWRKRIDLSRGQYQGASDSPRIPVILPWDIHRRLLLKDPLSLPSRPILRLNAAGFLDLAKLLGIAPETRLKPLVTSEIRCCLDYLETHYPDWRQQAQMFILQRVS